MTNPVHLAAVQMDVVFAGKAANIHHIIEKMEETAAAGASIIIFPECAITGYCYKSLEEAMPQAEPVPGPATSQIADACKRLGVHVVVGMLESDDDKIYNCCVLIGPGGVVGSYRKIHLPDLGVDKFVTPGDRPFAVHNAGDVRLGMNICYDAAFPESSRILALAGADIIVLPTNWPPGAETTACFAVNARALENNVFYVATNRAGVERGFEFIGNSKICEPRGGTMAQAEGKGEEILYADIEYTKARNKRLVRVEGEHEINRFADRRPEMYGLLTQSKEQK